MMSLLLAARRSSAAHSRTCATLPGADVSAGAYSDTITVTINY